MSTRVMPEGVFFSYKQQRGAGGGDESDDFDRHYFFLHFSKNAEFVITSTEPAL